MIEGFWYGIFGGLFGLDIARFLQKFKYWVVFLMSALIWEIFFLCIGIYYRGWQGVIKIFYEDQKSFFIIFLFSPLGVGLTALLVAFMGSLHTKGDQ